jgi:hypothetical protein
MTEEKKDPRDEIILVRRTAAEKAAYQAAKQAGTLPEFLREEQEKAEKAEKATIDAERMAHHEELEQYAKDHPEEFQLEKP